MNELYFNQQDKCLIFSNVNVFIKSDSAVVDDMCINNVANIIYKTINNNESYLFQRFSEKFIYDQFQKKLVSLQIAKDFFAFIEQQKISSVQAMNSLQYNISQFVQAYALFLFGD